jgi:hypothetical protein
MCERMGQGEGEEVPGSVLGTGGGSGADAGSSSGVECGENSLSVAAAVAATPEAVAEQAGIPEEQGGRTSDEPSAVAGEKESGAECAPRRAKRTSFPPTDQVITSDSREEKPKVSIYFSI